MRTFIMLALTIFLLSSCKNVVRIIYGVRSPKVENKESLIHYLNKKNIRNDNILISNYEGFISTIQNAGLIPNIRCFNQNGIFIPYKNDSACNGSAFEFIDSLKFNKSYMLIDSILLKNETSHLSDLDGNPVSYTDSNLYDYVIFIYWARWSGLLNKDHVKIWEESALNNPNARIKVHKVNCDVQESWGKENAGKALSYFTF